jgi:peptide/nickel transport system substrate-binding protein
LWLVNRTLTIIDDRGQVRPLLATSVPSVERGDWQVSPDGTMEQTWQLHPHARWQDGHPLTADDFVFTWEVLANPNLPPSGQGPVRSLLSDVTAPDPTTLRISFKATSPLAANALFDPLPRHILGDSLASGDVEQFVNHPHWTAAYIGAGPFRLTTWEPGVFQEYTAFEGYVEGRPKLDRITFRFLSDANVLMAAILNGDIEVALPDGLPVEAAAELRRGWGAPGTGNSVLIYADGRIARVEFQHRPEYAKPAAARDPRVRRAFYHTIDKDGLNEVESAGLAKLADSWIPPNDPRRPLLQEVIPEWSYDLGLAQRILEDAGWRRGADGVYVHGASGERLETEIQTTLSARGNAMGVLASGWRTAGAAVIENVLPGSLAVDREYRAKLPFAGLIVHPVTLQFEYQHHACERASSAENRWSGAHYGYCSPQADPLIMGLQTTLREADRTALQREILRIMLKEDMALLPMYWYVTVITQAKGISGLTELESGAFGTGWSPWNSHLWDKAR